MQVLLSNEMIGDIHTFEEWKDHLFWHLCSAVFFLILTVRCTGSGKVLCGLGLISVLVSFGGLLLVGLSLLWSCLWFKLGCLLVGLFIISAGRMSVFLWKRLEMHQQFIPTSKSNKQQLMPET